MQIKDLIPWARKDEAPKETHSEATHPMVELQREMNRAFDSFWRRFETPFGGLTWSDSMAKTDVVETDAAVEVTIELPGMAEGDLDISLSNDALTIKGEKKMEKQEEKRGYYVSERSYGSVMRTIPLPSGIDRDKAEANFKNGVLTVTLPRTPEAKAEIKRVTVKAA